MWHVACGICVVCVICVIHGGSFDKERWFSKKVLSGETQGPIRRNTVSWDRTADKQAVLCETVFLRIGPRVFHRDKCVFAHLEQHLNPMSRAREVHWKLPLDRARLKFENGSRRTR